MGIDLKQALLNRKRELLKFDLLSDDEKRIKTEQGLNPHESRVIRARRKALYLEQRKRKFDAMPAETRAELEELGLSPYQVGQPIRRLGGTFTIKK